jgi:hypothetical protein
MKANELRIGNYLEYDLEDVKINSIGRVYLNHKGKNYITNKIKVKEYEPIPLTEEWLVKFGFYFDGVRYQKEINNNLWVFVKNNVYGWYCPHIEVSNGIKYVHLLQNLVFALTGEELTIK